MTFANPLKKKITITESLEAKQAQEAACPSFITYQEEENNSSQNKYYFEITLY